MDHALSPQLPSWAAADFLWKNNLRQALIIFHPAHTYQKVPLWYKIHRAGIPPHDSPHPEITLSAFPGYKNVRFPRHKSSAVPLPSTGQWLPDSMALMSLPHVSRSGVLPAEILHRFAITRCLHMWSQVYITCFHSKKDICVLRSVLSPVRRLFPLYRHSDSFSVAGHPPAEKSFSISGLYLRLRRSSTPDSRWWNTDLRCMQIYRNNPGGFFS